MSRHEDPSHKGQNETWLSPLAIVSALGTFDLDPCAAPSPRPWPTALRHIELPEDGLRSEWHGRVWLNPPYGDKAADWLAKMAAHRMGIALIAARTDTRAWAKYVWPIATSIMFVRNRVDFYLPCGTRSHRSGHGSVLVAYSANDADHVWASGIQGAIVEVKRP